MNTITGNWYDGNFRVGDIVRMAEIHSRQPAGWLQSGDLRRVVALRSQTVLEVVEYRGDRQVIGCLALLLIAKFATLTFIASFAL